MAQEPPSPPPDSIADKTSTRVGSPPTPPLQFTPGSMLARRYRIVNFLGRGGMGEVYRAEDTKLAQGVALKFLPASGDSEALRRFLGEVRVGRQITHPNVCRIHDIVEVDGLHFISMEYVDGEDLASLLRRVGRLTPDKALALAREICAGLAAAHDKGIIHRDLKPANVLVDGRGRARITDFGLAGLARELEQGSELAGTPAYMAPEQLKGAPPSFRTDIYSLGMVLYEMFTGERPVTMPTEQELEPPSQGTEAHRFPREVDRAVQRITMRCLAKDPGERPASLDEVISVLPGGDLLQAAAASGEAPSPEMLAAARVSGALRAETAWLSLGAAFVGIALLAATAPDSPLTRIASLDKSPAVLLERARDVVRRAGYTATPGDYAFWFSADRAALRQFFETDRSPSRLENLRASRPGPMTVFYRQSPQSLFTARWDGKVTPNDPPSNLPGRIEVRLDSLGRLVAFQAVPSSLQPGALAERFNWASFFNEAELDFQHFTPTSPVSIPPVGADARLAWKGIDPGMRGTSLRVEAASLDELPVFFRLSREGQSQPRPGPGSVRFPVAPVLYSFALVFSTLLARRNFLDGRGDRSGSFRLAAFVFTVSVALFLTGANHVREAGAEWELLLGGVSRSLYTGAFSGLCYMALEPFARKRDPRLLIGWRRLVGGQFRDPLVGREVLVGVLGGLAAHLALVVGFFAPGWLNRPPPAFLLLESGAHIGLAAIPSFGQLLSGIFMAFQWSLVTPFLTLFIILFFRSLVRSRLVAAGLFVIAWTASILPGENIPLELAAYGLGVVAMAWVTLRIGVLAAAVGSLVYALGYMPITLDVESWFFYASCLSLGLMAALAVYGFYVSLAGKPLFGASLMQD